MVRFVRTALLPVANGNAAPGNASLALDRYGRPLGDNRIAVHALAERVCAAAAPEIYHAAYERWRACLERCPQIVTRRFRVQSRLIVGLGNESVHETSITLQRIYGVPYIPGSALKGLARRYAQHVASDDPESPLAVGGVDHATLFGEQRAAAYVTYFDAWYIPGSANKQDHPLARDVMTVHHPDYYGKRGTGSPPWDFDDPIPVPFLSARGEYLIAVQGPNPEWAIAALSILERALAEWGVGAKTSSGYGRLVPVEVAEEAVPPVLAEQGEPEQTPIAVAAPAIDVQALIEKVRTMPPARVRQDTFSVFRQWQTLDGPSRRVLAETIVQRLEDVRLLREWSAKPWVRELQEYLSAES